MEISEIKEKEEWENFFQKCQEKTFLNSWNWGEFQKIMGNKVWRLGILNGREILSANLVIKVLAKRGDFLFLPHGPSVNFEFESLKFEILKTLTERMKKIAEEEKVNFFRVGPIWEKNKENEEFFKKLKFREAPIHIHPELTWELDINKSEKELLMGMRKTTRYLIRQAIKNSEVKIEEKNDLEGIEIFNEIYQLTKERHGFVPFSLDYLKNEFFAFSQDNQISVLLGKYRGEVISGGIFIFWQKIAFYHHGASSQKYPKIPVSYFLLWEAIKKAKEKGCEKFNFWGICNLDQKKHPWYGLSLFKTGFGGNKKEYLKTQDLPISKRYWLIFIIEKLRKIKRRL